MKAQAVINLGEEQLEEIVKSDEEEVHIRVSRERLMEQIPEELQEEMKE